MDDYIPELQRALGESLYLKTRVERFNAIVREVCIFTYQNTLKPLSAQLYTDGLMLFCFAGEANRSSVIAYDHSMDKITGAAGISQSSNKHKLTVGTLYAGISRRLIQAALDTARSSISHPINLYAENENQEFLLQEELRLARDDEINLPHQQDYIKRLHEEQERWKKLFGSESFLGFRGGKIYIQPEVQLREQQGNLLTYGENFELTNVEAIQDFSTHEYVLNKVGVKGSK